MIRKILIANRGEIAIRIIRSCREMDIQTVAVFSEADRNSMHVHYADEAYFIGPSPAQESYLNMRKIIEIAKYAKVDAIHPGYGFLSENAEFAKKVTRAGILFIGPSPRSIFTMGDKITARKTIVSAGIPIVPGLTEDLPLREMVNRIFTEIGLPVMIKASAGGGGKGMRLVRTEKELLSALRAAKSEARMAFGDDTVYVEKYIESPHHIEFQILADSHGNIIHLNERECSIQRRHQKIVEETPSPLMSPELREEMGNIAIQVARSVDYEGAGTVEFLMDDSLNYYFLEMNTRLQVEHPITERVTGIDLVKEQIRIASGEELGYTQKDIKLEGHALECRIYAEDPYNNFMPSSGTIKKVTEPNGFGVRSDGYVYEGYEIPIHYDSMISKLITWGYTRQEAIKRMRRSLREFYIMGVKTTISFLDRIMETPDFVEGKYDTGFIEKNLDFLMQPCLDISSDPKFLDLALITAFLEYQKDLKTENGQENASQGRKNDWKQFGKQRGLLRF